MTLRMVDHLNFGARVESIAGFVDGAPAFEAQETSRGQLERLSVEPGAHTITIVFRVSEPCGLLPEPRASMSVRTEASFSIGERAATLEADLYPQNPTSDLLRNLAVRFTGNQLTLGAPAEAELAPDGCEKDDALCALETRASNARSRGDRAGAACFESRLGEARDLQGTLEDSYSTVTRDGSTIKDAEKAQLRARYARARLRSLPREAEACTVHDARTFSAGTVDRRIERSCPTPDVTAELDRFE
jgi:hypothetical protein